MMMKAVWFQLRRGATILQVAARSYIQFISIIPLDAAVMEMVRAHILLFFVGPTTIGRSGQCFAQGHNSDSYLPCSALAPTIGCFRTMTILLLLLLLVMS
jgi:hypothetical protein